MNLMQGTGMTAVLLAGLVTAGGQLEGQEAAKPATAAGTSHTVNRIAATVVSLRIDSR